MKLTRLALAGVILFATGCGAKQIRLKHSKITSVPPHCVVITQFDKPCTVDPVRHDGTCNGVHYIIRADPDCNEYNSERVLNIGKPQ